MKLYIKLLSLVAVMALSMTSCDKDNKDNPVITEQTFPSFYASVNDLSNGVSALYSNVSYLVYLNYSTMRAEVHISGLKLSVSYLEAEKGKNTCLEIDERMAYSISGNNVDGYIITTAALRK